MWYKQYLVRQGLSEFTLVESVGYEDAETRSPTSFSSWVVHVDGTGTTMWFYEAGDDLFWGDITCTRAKKRKNNYY